jgi:hypothetical protein
MNQCIGMRIDPDKLDQSTVYSRRMGTILRSEVGVILGDPKGIMLPQVSPYYEFI